MIEAIIYFCIIRKSYKKFKKQFQHSLSEMDGIIRGLKSRYDQMPMEQKRALFIAALTTAAGAFSQMSTMKEMGQLQRQQSELKLTGMINQANSLGMNINPSNFF